MDSAPPHRFSEPPAALEERHLPEKATPVGYAALIRSYGLATPLPRTLSAIGERHRIIERDGWRILTPRHAPHDNLEGHLTFAFKYEGLDLAVLKRLFVAVGGGAIEAIVRAKPTGSYARRIWFLFEWLTGERLGLPDAARGSYVPIVDAERQCAIPGENSSRHRVRNNLPGTPGFCPLVYRTGRLEQLIAMDLPRLAQAAVASVPRELMARAAAFLLLKDSKASYAIEGETPPQDRIQRWGRAIGEAGRQPLDLETLLRLQRIVVGDARFVRLGLRQSGGFVGEHDHESRAPLPDHISARPDDLPSLIEGLAAFDTAAARQLDPVVAAAVLAFGFVYIHPFEDGNGRLHRYLMHHVLAERRFFPPGIVFPVSAAILERADEYRRVLEDYSRRLLPLISWQPTASGNVTVLNDTADFYRYFDATSHAEFLYACVQKTIEEDLPDEARFLQSYDRFRAGVEQVIDMPETTINLLFRFLRQSGGALSGRARQHEFAALTDEEASRIIQLYCDIFGKVTP
jgi:hypothetical protein